MSGAARREKTPSPASSGSAPGNPRAGQPSSRQAGAGRGASADPEDRRADAMTAGARRKTKRTPQRPGGNSVSSSEGGAGAGPGKRQDRRTSRPAQAGDDVVNPSGRVGAAQDDPGPSNVPAPRETTPPRGTQRSASGPYAPQIATVLRYYPDPQVQSRIFRVQLDTLTQTQRRQGQDVANDEIVRQLRQVIEELEEETRERERERRVQRRRDEATRHRTASQGNTTQSSGGQSGPSGSITGIDGDGSSQAVISAPASYGPSRSGNPDYRSSSGMAVHSAPASAPRAQRP